MGGVPTQNKDAYTLVLAAIDEGVAKSEHLTHLFFFRLFCCGCQFGKRGRHGKRDLLISNITQTRCNLNRINFDFNKIKHICRRETQGAHSNKVMRYAAHQGDYHRTLSAKLYNHDL